MNLLIAGCVSLSKIAIYRSLQSNKILEHELQSWISAKIKLSLRICKLLVLYIGSKEPC